MSEEMTNHEAVEFLKNMIGEECGRAIGKDGFYAELMGYHVRALKKAIAALEEEPMRWIPVSERLPHDHDWYLIVVKEKDTGYQYIPRVATYLGNNKWEIIDTEDAIKEWIDSLECIAWMSLPKPYEVEPQESEEISREEIAALLAMGSEEMTREEAIVVLQGYLDNPLINNKEPFNMAISALSDQRTGHWIKHNTFEKWECSCCGVQFRFPFKEHYFCPNCGAKMESEDKE